MTAASLPNKLKKEPLVDAVFEIRFSSSTAASSILSGFFFAKLQLKEWKAEPLPIAEIPSQIRSLDPNLRYQPTMKIHWDDFFILIGGMTLGVGCKIPYPGWIKFKKRIIQVVQLLKETNIVHCIERYSLKYVDVVEAENLGQQIERINFDLRVGSHIVRGETFTVHVEIPHDNFLSIIKLGAPATARMLDGRILKGSLIDIDTICKYETNDLDQLTKELPDRLEAIHTINKQIFFDCLTRETIDFLEPIYE